MFEVDSPFFFDGFYYALGVGILSSVRGRLGGGGSGHYFLRVGVVVNRLPRTRSLLTLLT